MIKVKRIYDVPGDDGFRVLVDRLWPRGMRKEAARIDLWLKEIAPSDGLRTWFGHDPGKWEEFKKRYCLELETKSDLVRLIREKSREGEVTLLCAAKEERFNNAAFLKEYLEKGICDTSEL
jgi:uncharacterized protein YeaO (DUF488 family)